MLDYKYHFEPVNNVLIVKYKLEFHLDSTSESLVTTAEVKLYVQQFDEREPSVRFALTRFPIYMDKYGLSLPVETVARIRTTLPSFASA